ncbi:hypothetical protein K9L97_04670 [Candidatus Woesearchaeota archaeon]|nr:hypothetical protein [Candidatus Woesearchaeota archaeon]
MVKIIITESLKKEIHKKFKSETNKIFALIYTLKETPKKGKFLSLIGDIVLKEIKYKKFRFYFITDNHKIKFLKVEELQDLVIKFIRMSDKKSQDKVIEEIKDILKLKKE